MAQMKSKMTICEVKVACDGADIQIGKEMCAACRKRLSKKKAPKGA